MLVVCKSPLCGVIHALHLAGGPHACGSVYACVCVCSGATSARRVCTFITLTGYPHTQPAGSACMAEGWRVGRPAGSKERVESSPSDRALESPEEPPRVVASLEIRSALRCHDNGFFVPIHRHIYGSLPYRQPV